jgi:diguanylate cyclase (GGDEF)-like protein
MINILLIEKYLIIIVLLNLINWIISARIEIKNEIVNKIISLGATILLITYSLEALIIYMTTIKIELSLFGIIVFIISLSAIALSDIEELFVIVQKHREQSERYYDKSIKDQMTDLYNKEFIRNELFASDYKYSLIMFDIDDFKAINDTYGHDVGDQAIINVANIAKHMVRSSDVVGRFGGDEFIIIAKECNAENAYRIAKQIKDKVESQLYIEKNELDIRISMGIYENFTNNPFEVALKNVDDRLYMAKEQGKSTIVWDDNG